MAVQSRQLIPAVSASYAAEISTPTNVTVSVRAGQIIELTSLAEGIYGRWTGTASSTLFDLFIPALCTRNYEVPAGVTVLKITSSDNVVAIVY